MATKRMFSNHIVDTDAFLDMPSSSQLLYFHLAMRADDEGFVGSPKKIMRMCGFQDDNLKILIAKRFILTFNSGVVVIKHWLIHNTIRMDRFNPTTYQDEKKTLKTRTNKAYTEIRQPNGNQTATQVKLSKVNSSKVKLNKVKLVSEQSSPLSQKTKKFIIEIKETLKGDTLKKNQVEEIRKFVSYWTEPNRSKTKLRWELEKTWDTKRRIGNWMRNGEKFKKTNKYKIETL